MQNNVKAKARRFLKEFGVKTVSLASLNNSLIKQGYTVIPFNKLYNDPNVAAIIHALHLEQHIEHSHGFTYVDQHRRLVFFNEDLSDTEKLIVLAHEEGHIYCNHFTQTPVIGKDVMQEHEANEFAHYLLHPTRTQLVRKTIRNHKFLFAACLLLVVAAIGTTTYFAVSRQQQYYGEYYLTESGSRFHKKECIFVKDKLNVHRLTEEDFYSGNYEPCGMCLPLEAENTVP